VDIGELVQMKPSFLYEQDAVADIRRALKTMMALMPGLPVEAKLLDFNVWFQFCTLLKQK